jgi:hypothetical protein
MNYFIFLGIIINFSLIAGNADFTSQLDILAENTCNNKISRTVNLGNGNFYFKSPPKPFTCALNIKGDGIGSTVLIRDYEGGTFLQWTRGTDQSGGSIRDLTILAGEGSNKGYAILVDSDKDANSYINSYNRHFFTIYNILIGRLSSNNTSWDIGIYLDGSKNPDNTEGIAPGIRMTQISNTTISGTNISHIYLNKARGPNLLNVDCFIPLKGSINGVILDNATQGVKLDSRTCTWKFQDNNSSWIVYNGVRSK